MVSQTGQSHNCFSTHRTYLLFRATLYSSSVLSSCTLYLVLCTDIDTYNKHIYQPANQHDTENWKDHAILTVQCRAISPSDSTVLWPSKTGRTLNPKPKALQSSHQSTFAHNTDRQQRHLKNSYVTGLSYYRLGRIVDMTLQQNLLSSSPSNPIQQDASNNSRMLT